MIRAPRQLSPPNAVTPLDDESGWMRLALRHGDGQLGAETSNFAISTSGPVVNLLTRPLGTCWSVLSVVLILAILAGRSANAETSRHTNDAAPKMLPSEMRLDLPDAVATDGGERRVLLVSDSGADEAEVGLVFLEVGERFVVLLADGRLRSINKREATLTERPFTPLPKRELGLQLANQRFPGFEIRSTRRYLYISNASRTFTNATSRILESMYPAVVNYCRRQRLTVTDPAFPLVVIIFRTQEQFQAFHKVDDDVIAYYNPITNWIVLYEQSELTNVAPELAFKQAVSTVAHEGVHQILNNVGVQRRLSRWPLWFSEGLAEYFAPTELNRRVRWKGVGLVNDLRLHELSVYYQQHRDEFEDGSHLRQLVHSEHFDSIDYAKAWSLIHYLARSRRDEFRECFLEISQLKPLERIPPNEIFSRYFSANYKEIESEVVGHLRDLPYSNPILSQTHFVVVVKDRAKPHLTSSPKKLREIKKKLGTKSYQIRAFPNRQTAEQFAKTIAARNQ